MFYWTVGHREVVLTDEEEDGVLKRAGLTVDERFDFRIATPNGASLQRRVGKYLEDYARTAPQEFELEFVRRSGTGPEHLAELRALIDAYARTCGRLGWGAPKANGWREGLGSRLWLGSRPDVVHLSILHPVRRWFRHEWDVVGQISFPAAEIERFYGTGESLFIATSGMLIRAGEGLVQVLNVPEDDSNAPWAPTRSPMRSHLSNPREKVNRERD
jgi:hypothetical protein